MNRRYLIANWKMNVPPEGIEPYMSALGAKRRDDAALMVAPPYVYIPEVVRLSHGVTVGAQNCGDQKSGAFTGEVSAPMLKDAGARFAIVGHSERRNVYHEPDALVARRMAMALDHGLTTVLCIGEDLRVREAGHVSRFLADQVKAVVGPSLDNADELVVAYEPIWAIGTGRNASGAMVAETVEEIREAIGRFWPGKLAGTPVLYGGSVTPDNIGDLWQNGRIDGFLVGGASLHSGKFLAIYDGMKAA